MPNFFLSHKRVEVARRIALPPRWSQRSPRPGFEANAPRSGPRSAEIRHEIPARKESGSALLPTFRSSLSTSATPFANFGKSWALELAACGAGTSDRRYWARGVTGATDNEVVHRVLGPLAWAHSDGRDRQRANRTASGKRRSLSRRLRFLRP